MLERIKKIKTESIMEKIKLSKESKRILQSISEGSYTCPVPKNDLSDVKILRQKGFVHSTELSSGEVISLELSEMGQTYIYQNPKLKNPSIFDDTKYVITTSISILALVVAFIALFK